ncbi:hypothetical protein XH94_37250 [Bradyrhizobium zhanjiangense]|uniref:Uncharacterized protein n=1 Tax=Bradyrhizobium zhanjiangense TaxID=1325107 RepID=A0A4V1L103_9BRAD|nr:hypothetical protein XH94_37250 [Bradyrhizobium zhanjiangense]
MNPPTALILVVLAFAALGLAIVVSAVLIDLVPGSEVCREVRGSDGRTCIRSRLFGADPAHPAVVIEIESR